VEDSAPVKWGWTSCKKTLRRNGAGLALYEANLRADVGLGYDKLHAQFWSMTPHTDLRRACREPRTAGQMVTLLEGREPAREAA